MFEKIARSRKARVAALMPFAAALALGSPAEAQQKAGPKLEQASPITPASKEQSLARRTIEKEQALPIIRFRSRSGIVFDMYQTSTGQQRELEVDPGKFDSLVFHAFDQLEEYSTEQTYYRANDIQRLVQEGRQGLLTEAVITMIFSSDPNTCIARNPDNHRPNVGFSIIGETTDCMYIGLTSAQASKIPDPSRGHFPTVLVGQPREWLVVSPGSYNDMQYLLDSNLRMLAQSASPIPVSRGPQQPEFIPINNYELSRAFLEDHELLHAILALLDVPPDQSLADLSHRQVVLPAVNRFAFECSHDPGADKCNSVTFAAAS